MNNDKLDELKQMTNDRSHCPYFYELVEELVKDYEDNLVLYNILQIRTKHEQEIEKYEKPVLFRGVYITVYGKQREALQHYLDYQKSLLTGETAKDAGYDLELIEKVKNATECVRVRMKSYPTAISIEMVANTTIGTELFSRLFREELSKQGIEE